MSQNPEPPLRKMEFVPEIERQALRIIAQDSMFMVKWRNRLKPEHFNEPHIQVLFKVISEYVEQYNKLPTLEITYQGIKNHIGSYDNYESFVTYATDLFGEKFRTDAEAVKDCLMAHMRAVDYDRFLIQSALSISNREYGDVEKNLKEITVRHTSTTPVEAYRSNAADSIASRVSLEKERKMAFPSPWPTFNSKHGGGFKPSAVSAFMGPTGSGKSILLVNAGTHAFLQGKTVYHFTFELSALDTKARYDVCSTGCGFAERMTTPKLLDDRLDQLKNIGRLYVIQLSTGTCSANDVRASINEYEMMGCPKPDLIVLDYLTIMMPNNPDNVDMKRDYAKLKAIAEEVRAMAMDLDVPVITALQANRGAAGKEKISKEDIADSYAVMHVLDLVLSINQNDAEKAAGKLRLYAAKVRSHEDGYTIALDVTYSNLRVFEDPTTTANYNAAVAKMTADALNKRTVAGVHAPLPAATVNPEDASAGLDCILGMSVNPVKARNDKTAPPISQADQAQAAGWGNGLIPPPIAPPIAPPTPPTKPE